jgi:hypothetical protein
MDELPFHYPQLCLDIKQWAIELGDPQLPPQSGPQHHALFDARWTRDAGRFSLVSIPPPGSGGPPVARTPTVERVAIGPQYLQFQP